MCHVLGVKSNNYYSYQMRKTSKPDDSTHQDMIDLVKDIAKFRDNTYGSRRIQRVLNTLSYGCRSISDKKIKGLNQIIELY
jgi:putative transposase